MTDEFTPKIKTERQLRREARRDRNQKAQDLYGLTRSTQIFLGAIIVLLFILVGGTIAYLTLALNDARNVDRTQDIAISEWSRRYVSLYDQYQNATGKKPTSLSPSAVEYLIASESKDPNTSAIPGLPVTNGGGSVSAPSVTYNVQVDGKTVKVNCVPVSDFDPVSPEYMCK